MRPEPQRPVAILHGAIPPDARPDDLDTLVQRDAVIAAFAARGRTAVGVELGLDLSAAAARLRELAPALVFNLVETVAGSDALLPLGPLLLEHLGLPYTGCDSGALALTSDKLVAKRLMRAAGIPTPAGPEAGVEGRRWIVKSATAHASLGLDEGSVVDASAVDAAIAEKTARYGGRWFAEAFVPGREFNLAVLDGPDGPQVLPPAEILLLAGVEIVGYAAKWDEASAAARATPRRADFPPSDEPLLGELAVLARRCWETFGLRGYARVDFRVDEQGRPFVLEVNANPCLSPDAGFAAAAARAGLFFDDVVARIAASANRPAQEGVR